MKLKSDKVLLLLLLGLLGVCSGLIFGMSANADKIRYLEDVFTAVENDSDIIWINIAHPDSSSNINLEVHHWYPAGDTLANGDTVNAIPIIFHHGGGYTSGDESKYGNLPNKICLKGYQFFSFAYRVTGQAANRSFIYGAGDMRSAVSWLKSKADSFHVDTTRIILAGESAGGYNALIAGLAKMDVALDSQTTVVSGTTTKSHFAVSISGALVANDLSYWNLTDSVSIDDTPAVILSSELDTIVLPAWQDTTIDSTVNRLRIHRFEYQGVNAHAINDYPGNDAAWPAMFLANEAYRYFFGTSKTRFPTALDTLDNFNRTNEGPPPSASWTNIGSGLAVRQSQLGNPGATGQRISVWGTSFSTGDYGTEVIARMSLKGGTTAWTAIHPYSNGTTPYNAYEVRFREFAGADTVTLFKWVSSSQTTLQRQSIEYQVGDDIGARYDPAEGRIWVFIKPKGFVHSYVLYTLKDASHTATTSSPGASENNWLSKEDDFRAGRSKLQVVQ